ncbi:MAG: hypothetical protein GX589_05490 [Deltaproteobacteria bacterium]|nr:hypothetical protein [Deltaproteobacteria bacterium]
MQAFNFTYPFRSKTAGAAASAQKAYSLQYISLILIVLTFVIGVFMSGPVRVAKESAPVHAASMGFDPGVLISDMEYSDLFQAQAEISDNSKVAALASLLRSHDIDLEAEVYSGAGQEGLMLALERAQAIFEALVQAGVPSEALKIFAHEKHSDSQLRVRLYKAGPNV